MSGSVRRRRGATDARAAAAQAVLAVLRHGRSLSDALPSLLQRLPAGEDRSLAQELAYGTLRHQPRLAFWLGRLLERPLRQRDGDVEALLLVGLYQCSETRVPEHAAVSSLVEVARTLRQPWAGGLVNAVLRRFLREREALQSAALADPVAAWAHPQWLLQAYRRDWPDHWQAILAANNARPPMTLRVNRRRTSPDAYRARLAAAGLEAEPHPLAADALVLSRPVPVDALPGFAEGLVSVQDAAGQLAVDLLALEPGQRVLDLCAAPGSKTCHILERRADLAGVTAVDVSAQRLQRLEENLQRLGLAAELRLGDGLRPETWWDGRPYQRILLDVPCSATGVIRRHPDIKLLRRQEDIPALTALQGALLDAAWPLLEPGGMLVYATCSMLRAENSGLIQGFVRRCGGAAAVEFGVDWGWGEPVGRQILCGAHGMDGFYYAVLRKR